MLTSLVTRTITNYIPMFGIDMLTLKFLTVVPGWKNTHQSQNLWFQAQSQHNILEPMIEWPAHGHLQIGLLTPSQDAFYYTRLFLFLKEKKSLQVHVLQVSNSHQNPTEEISPALSTACFQIYFPRLWLSNCFNNYSQYEMYYISWPNTHMLRYTSELYQSGSN